MMSPVSASNISFRILDFGHLSLNPSFIGNAGITTKGSFSFPRLDHMAYMIPAKNLV